MVLWFQCKSKNHGFVVFGAVFVGERGRGFGESMDPMFLGDVESSSD